MSLPEYLQPKPKPESTIDRIPWGSREEVIGPEILPAIRELNKDKARLDRINQIDDGYFDWFNHPRDVRSAIDKLEKI